MEIRGRVYCFGFGSTLSTYHMCLGIGHDRKVRKNANWWYINEENDDNKTMCKRNGAQNKEERNNQAIAK